jgi:hypothetical protein
VKCDSSSVLSANVVPESVTDRLFVSRFSSVRSLAGLIGAAVYNRPPRQPSAFTAGRRLIAQRQRQDERQYLFPYSSPSFESSSRFIHVSLNIRLKRRAPQGPRCISLPFVMTCLVPLILHFYDFF